MEPRDRQMPLATPIERGESDEDAGRPGVDGLVTIAAELWNDQGRRRHVENASETAERQRSLVVLTNQMLESTGRLSGATSQSSACADLRESVMAASCHPGTAGLQTAYDPCTVQHCRCSAIKTKIRHTTRIEQRLSEFD